MSKSAKVTRPKKTSAGLVNIGLAARRHKVLTILIIVVLIVAALLLSSVIWQYGDARKARTTTSGPYKDTLESINKHPVPDWYDGAKFGVMIHWGLYSVPGYAPKGVFNEVLKNDYPHAMVRQPYSEDYWNAMKDPSSPTAKWHKEHYGTMAYEGFKPQFEAQLKDWDANVWAKQFSDAGARYVVITAKYADGYALWPTKVENSHQRDWHSQRDLIGEMATAVRKRGMKFGLYYSGGVDWTFQRHTVHSLGDYAYLHYGADYADYAEAQVRELISLYKPDILWNDISWPTGQDRLNALLADYYNTVPEGVVNDRWQTRSFGKGLMNLWPLRRGFDLFMGVAVKQPGLVEKNISKPQPVPHSDFTTPEYAQYDIIQSKKWENDRGIGNSFGFNREETDADYASFEKTLFPELVNAVSKNGNYLLNVGPSGGNGMIVPEQAKRLQDFGAWLKHNGEAVYDTKPWRQADAKTTDGQDIRITQNDHALYLIILGKPTGNAIIVKQLEIKGAATPLGQSSPISVDHSNNDTTFTFTKPLDGSFAPVIRVDQ